MRALSRVRRKTSPLCTVTGTSLSVLCAFLTQMAIPIVISTWSCLPITSMYNHFPNLKSFGRGIINPYSRTVGVLFTVPRGGIMYATIPGTGDALHTCLSSSALWHMHHPDGDYRQENPTQPVCDETCSGHPTNVVFPTPRALSPVDSLPDVTTSPSYSSSLGITASTQSYSVACTTPSFPTVVNSMHPDDRSVARGPIYSTIGLFQNAIQSTDVENFEEGFQIEAETIARLRRALIDFIKHRYLHPTGPYTPPPDVRISPSNITLGTVLRYHGWIWHAGGAGDDAFGDGVVRQCLSGLLHEDPAIQGCLTINHADSYYTIQSSDFQGDESYLLKLRCLGTIAMMHIVQIGHGPEPLSPVLIQATLGGVRSVLYDEAWLTEVDPDTMATIKLLRHDGGPTLSEISLLSTDDKRSLQSLLNMHARTHQLESLHELDLGAWRSFRETLLCKATLGFAPNDFDQRPEIKAFRAGMDLHITNEIPSLSDVRFQQ
ncbi:hypothetical protein NLI96_g9078 [Meripilus lineatus]|uniref:Uncharacterized protein n=1 Tax=Meripilus lineatus TaxID=2056292 RepID=A0AAD5UW31_9APHY|nr:hypothetical protein NLI96_g9078 [Physisporinus lineatus]